MWHLFKNLFGKKPSLKSVRAGWFILFAPLAAAATQSVSLNWNPSDDPTVAGYKIYYGQASGDYTQSIAVGNVTNTVLSGLADGATYFFAATTYDASGAESDFSTEASFAIPGEVNLPDTNSVDTNPPVIVPPINPPNTNPPVVVPPVVTPPVVIPPDVLNLPTLNAINDVTLNENAGAQSVAITGISSGLTGKNNLVRVTVATSNPGLVRPTVNYTSSKSTGTISFKPVANASGSAVITVTVNNGAKINGLVSQRFTVTIAPPTSSNAASRIRSNPQLPKFSRSLTNIVALAGKPISLNVAATGKAPLHYQWKFNGTPIAGATAAALTFKNSNPAQSGSYTVTVSNTLGTSTDSAQVMVYSTTAAALSAMDKSVSGNFRLQLTGIPGSKYVVQASTDMTHWSNVQTNTAPFTFEDVNSAAYGQRFYRSYCISE